MKPCQFKHIRSRLFVNRVQNKTSKTNLAWTRAKWKWFWQKLLNCSHESSSWYQNQILFPWVCARGYQLLKPGNLRHWYSGLWWNFWFSSSLAKKYARFISDWLQFHLSRNWPIRPNVEISILNLSGRGCLYSSERGLPWTLAVSQSKPFTPPQPSLTQLFACQAVQVQISLLISGLAG